MVVGRLGRRQVRDVVVPLVGQLVRKGAPACQAAAVQPDALCALARKLGLQGFLAEVVPLLLQLLLSPQSHSDIASSLVLQVCGATTDFSNPLNAEPPHSESRGSSIIAGMPYRP